MSFIAPRPNETGEGWFTYDTIDINGLVHVVPTFGPDHVCTTRCWCHPELCSDDARLLIHNVAH